eukprot:11447039-Ditylum_brightwellii.AAC.1
MPGTMVIEFDNPASGICPLLPPGFFVNLLQGIAFGRTPCRIVSKIKPGYIAADTKWGDLASAGKLNNCNKDGVL